MPTHQLRSERHAIRPTFLGTALLCAVFTVSPVATAATDDATAYCQDLQKTVDAKLRDSVQRRMPEEMPGEYMDEKFGVDETINTEVNYGVGSASAILGPLLKYIKNMLPGVQRNMLNQLEKVIAKNNGSSSGSGTVSMPAYTPTTTRGTGVNTTEEPQSPTMGVPASRISKAEADAYLNRLKSYLKGLF